MTNVRKYFVIILVILWAVVLLPRLFKRVCPLFSKPKPVMAKYIQVPKAADTNINITDSLPQGFKLLKIREDFQALTIFNQVLAVEPKNLDALWGKAEVFRRARNFSEAENIINQILAVNPNHTASLISLAYIRYKDDKLDEAQSLIEKVLKNTCEDSEDYALALMMLGTINSRRSAKSWFFGKIAYGAQIKGHFLKAKEIAPDLPEVHLGLGTFYLLAPAIFGGNIDKAKEELELAVEIAPTFATANARLAQVYLRKGNIERYSFYLKRTRSLDPENEVLKEIK